MLFKIRTLHFPCKHAKPPKMGLDFKEVPSIGAKMYEYQIYPDQLEELIDNLCIALEEKQKEIDRLKPVEWKKREMVIPTGNTHGGGYGD